MERRGSGFKKILADYEGQVEFDETKMPVFEADNDDFTLTLYNLNYGSGYATQTKQNGTQGDTQDDTQDDTQEEIIKMIEENPRVTTADMAKKLGIGIATVKRKIKKYCRKQTQKFHNSASFLFCISRNILNTM